MTRFEGAAVAILLVVVPIGGYGLAHSIDPRRISSYDGGWMDGLIGILLGIENLYFGVLLLMLLALGLNYVLVRLGIIDAKNENENEEDEP